MPTRRPARAAVTWLPPRLVAAAIAALALAWAGYLAWLVRTDPRVAFLPPDACGQWILADEPVLLGARHPGFYVTHFRTALPAGPARDGVLVVRALRIAEVLLDGRRVFAGARDLNGWKQEHRVPLRLEADAAGHELVVVVVNENGPPAVLACAPRLGIASGPGWESRRARDAAWGPARVAGPRPAELSRRFPRADQALVALWPWLLGVLLGVGALTVLLERSGRRCPLSPPMLRWLLIGGWVALGANNIGKLPLYVGFDVSAHLQYIRYLVEHWRVPLATEGWQMFQPPLYHAVSALLVWLPARPLVGEDAAVHLLRLVPLVCGATQVEIAYRAARHVFPERLDLQRLGTILGALLPVNLYASQYLGNEPLTGCLVGGAIVVMLGWLRAPETAVAVRSQMLVGGLLGLGMLAKPTAVLVVGPALLVSALAHAWAGRPPVAFVRAGARVLLVLVGVAGWYYVRNWILLGRPFVGGWDASRGIEWWQEPGYRVPAHLFSFGEALRYPIFGGVAGLWDAEYSTFWLDGWLSAVMHYDYRPPWNYALMLPAPWLALMPAGAMLAGAASAPWRRDPSRRQLILAAGLVAVYLVATLSLYLQVPIYAAAKATQMMGLAPCFAVLGAAGYEVIGRSRAARPLLYGATGCWALCTYLAYFVR